MKKNNKRIIPVEELNIHFDDKKVLKLEKKLFKGEITFDEYCKMIDEM